MNRYLTAEDIVDAVQDYIGWSPKLNSTSNKLMWTDGFGTTILATPNLEKDGVTSFVIFNDESGEFETAMELFLEPNRSFNSQLQAYIKTLQKVIKLTNR